MLRERGKNPVDKIFAEAETLFPALGLPLVLSALRPPFVKLKCVSDYTIFARSVIAWFPQLNIHH